MGRTLKIRANCWDPKMYNILEAATRRACPQRLIASGFFETEELIAIAWLTSTRYGCPLNRVYLHAIRAMRTYMARQFELRDRELYIKTINTHNEGYLYNDKILSEVMSE